jgi:hypothetical protein
MMNRRKFFGFLPFSAFGLVAAAKPEQVKAEDVSPWVEITCQRRAHYDWKERFSLDPKNPHLKVWVRGKMTIPPCGQKFKALRIPVSPICPKCDYRQDISKPGIREKFMGIAC